MKRIIVMVAALAVSAAAWAQEYPSKPVKIVLPYPLGGPGDFISRTVGEKLQAKFGQPFLVEPRPGANLRIATEFVAKSAPDGYTIAFIGVPHATNPTFFPNLPYDTLRDLAALVHLVDVPLVITVPPGSPVKNLQDLVATGKAKPGFTVGTAGVGTGPHLATEFLNLVSGANLTHVGYKGDAPAVTDLLGAHIGAGFNTMQAVVQHVRAGRLRGIGVASRERAAAMPDLPTIAEQGYPDVVVTTWFGFVAPAAVPRTILDRLNAEVNAALAAADVKEKFANAGLIPVGGSMEQFDGLIRAEITRWGRVIRERGIKPN
jgi:tripartite-type tricarboxylate transporter receptor subunit TctC